MPIVRQHRRRVPRQVFRLGKRHDRYRAEMIPGVVRPDVFAFDFLLSLRFGRLLAVALHVRHDERFSQRIDRQSRRIPADRKTTEQSALRRSECHHRHGIVRAVGNVKRFSVAIESQGIRGAAERQIRRGTRGNGLRDRAAGRVDDRHRIVVGIGHADITSIGQSRQTGSVAADDDLFDRLALDRIDYRDGTLGSDVRSRIDANPRRDARRPGRITFRRAAPRPVAHINSSAGAKHVVRGVADGYFAQRAAVRQIDFDHAVSQIEDYPKTLLLRIEGQAGRDRIRRFALGLGGKVNRRRCFQFSGIADGVDGDHSLETRCEKPLAVATEDDAVKTARDRRAAYDFLLIQIDEQNFIMAKHAQPAPVGAQRHGRGTARKGDLFAQRREDLIGRHDRPVAYSLANPKLVVIARLDGFCPVIFNRRRIGCFRNKAIWGKNTNQRKKRNHL